MKPADTYFPLVEEKLSAEYAGEIAAHYQKDADDLREAIQEPILNPGFQNWNYLVLNTVEWLKGREPVAEFGMRGPMAE